MNIEAGIHYTETPFLSQEKVFSVENPGLKGRFLLGGEYINSGKSISGDLSVFLEKRSLDYSVFAEASQKERKGYWREKGSSSEKVQEWAQQFASSFSEHRSFYENTDVGRRRAQFYQAFEIDVFTFDTNAAVNFYNTYLLNEQGYVQFLEDALTGSNVRESDEDSRFDDVRWIAHVFGERSSEVAVHLVELQNVLQEEDRKQRLFEQAFGEQMLVNNLSDDERELLSFVYENSSLSRVFPERDELLDEPAIFDDHAIDEEIEEDVMLEEGIAVDVTEKSVEPLRDADAAVGLIDYDTGLLSGERVDLLPHFSRLCDKVEEKLYEGDARFSDEEPTIVLSLETEAMIDKIATESNRRNVELAFHVMGRKIEVGDKTAYIGAYALPSMNYAAAQRAVSSTVPEFFVPNMLAMPSLTNLSEYFHRNCARDEGTTVIVGHTHQMGLGEYWKARPSQGDLDNFARWASSYPGSPSLWSVFTKWNDSLRHATRWTHMVDGSVCHQPVYMFPESSL